MGNEKSTRGKSFAFKRCEFFLIFLQYLNLKLSLEISALMVKNIFDACLEWKLTIFCCKYIEHKK